MSGQISNCYSGLNILFGCLIFICDYYGTQQSLFTGNITLLGTAVFSSLVHRGWRATAFVHLGHHSMTITSVCSLGISLIKHCLYFRHVRQNEKSSIPTACTIEVDRHRQKGTHEETWCQMVLQCMLPYVEVESFHHHLFGMQPDFIHWYLSRFCQDDASDLWKWTHRFNYPTIMSGKRFNM